MLIVGVTYEQRLLSPKEVRCRESMFQVLDDYGRVDLERHLLDSDMNLIIPHGAVTLFLLYLEENERNFSLGIFGFLLFISEFVASRLKFFNVFHQFVVVFEIGQSFMVDLVGDQVVVELFRPEDHWIVLTN
jgi:hypothetical protein